MAFADVSENGVVLQWCHVVVDVEGKALLGVNDDVGSASMGPRRRRRGRNLSPAPSQPASPCFNGATSSSTWKAMHGLPLFAAIHALQWGHVVVDVEGGPRLGRSPPRLRASMGPRRRPRGRAGTE